MSGGFDGFAERPPSETEWEELLVRFELAPRALRLAVDDARWSVGEEALLEPLAMLLAHEALVAEVLAAMREGRPAPDGAGAEGVGGSDVGALLERFGALRAKSFAAVQRRGIEVWDWRSEIGGRPVTAYQLLSAAVAFDGAMLEAVRAGSRGTDAC